MAKEMPRQQRRCRGISLANEKTNKYYEEKSTLRKVVSISAQWKVLFP